MKTGLACVWMRDDGERAPLWMSLAMSTNRGRTVANQAAGTSREWGGEAVFLLSPAAERDTLRFHLTGIWFSCEGFGTCRSIKSIMTNEHASEWLGFPVRLFDDNTSKGGQPNAIYRLALDWDAKANFPTLFSQFLAIPNSSQTPAIVIGQFHGDDPQSSSEEVVQLLVSAREKLPNLKGIFLGDIVSEENEISWIQQTDVSPLLTAYPDLEHLRLRGSDGLSLGGRLVHDKLKSLVIETGGLPPRVLQEVLASQLPALEHLELWLGTPSYGGDVTVADLQPLLQGGLFPKLKHLGLRDSEIVDHVATAIASAPVLGQLESLDLSLGIMSDVGAKALLDSPTARKLKKLDLHHHYISYPIMGALKNGFVLVNVEEAQDAKTDPDERYVAVSE